MIRDVLQIPVPKVPVRAMPSDEHTLVLVIGYAANQITMSVALPSPAATPDDSQSQASAQQNGGVADTRGALWFWGDG